MKLLVIITLIFSISSAIVQFNDEVVDSIFNSSQIYLTYAYVEKHSQNFNIFQEFCSSQKKCAVLNVNCPLQKPSLEFYQEIIQFVGFGEAEFVFIIDYQHQLKYVLEIDSLFSKQRLQEFQARFVLNELQPFYSSEKPKIDQNLNEKCMELVGVNYEQFLAQDQHVKVVYLYTKQQFCQVCVQFLSRFKQLAEEYFEVGVIRFGYIDVFKNDNRFIKDQIMPYILIYVRQNFDEPYGVQLEEFEQLGGYIKMLIDEIKGSGRTSNNKQGHQPTDFQDL